MRHSLRALAAYVLRWAPRRSGEGDRLILAYHNVIPDDEDVAGDSPLHLPLTRFEQQLRAIAHEADVVPLLELLEEAPGRRPKVAITFDDAYASALTLGVATCVRFGIPSTVFVSPKLLGTIPVWDTRAAVGEWSPSARDHFLWNAMGRAEGTVVTARPQCVDGASTACRISTAEELRVACQSTLVTLGNHSMRHMNLAAVATEHAIAELQEAHEWLTAAHPDVYIPVVAYPYGLSPKAASTVLEKTAMRFGLAVDGGWCWHGTPLARHAIPRWNVPADISEPAFRLRLRGWRADV